MSEAAAGSGEAAAGSGEDAADSSIASEPSEAAGEGELKRLRRSAMLLWREVEVEKGMFGREAQEVVNEVTFASPALPAHPLRGQ
jgi:hypothetical protein